MGINISKGAVENTMKNGVLSIVDSSSELPFKKKMLRLRVLF
jgi:hypothetical protein|tara:strand:+ start:71 stop:196 length:126 start_codon:yes stop_codon:yes gene_type:complete